MRQAMLVLLALTTFLTMCRTAPAVAPPARAAPLPTYAAPTPPPAQNQYRVWMQEARAQYPYDEPAEQMWQVMQCESVGEADTVSGSFYGLFQYHPDTWAGDWNPYRDLPILDPRAQIFATAKAWHDGYQSWWGCYTGS